MTVKELKQLLAKCDDEMQVLIPVNLEFDGRFYSPCPEDSGECSIGTGKPGPIYQSPTEEATAQSSDECEIRDVFTLVPCDFFEEHEDDHEHLMN